LEYLRHTQIDKYNLGARIQFHLPVAHADAYHKSRE